MTTPVYFTIQYDTVIICYDVTDYANISPMTNIYYHYKVDVHKTIGSMLTISIKCESLSMLMNILLHIESMPNTQFNIPDHYMPSTTDTALQILFSNMAS